MSKYLLLGLLFISWFSSSQILLVLDDVGYRHNDQLALQLPNDVIFAVIPQTPYAEAISQQAQQQGRELLIHMPMQATSDRALGKLALTDELSESEFKQRVEQAIRSVPNPIGLNNHMGSLLTTAPQQMHWLMQVLQQHQLLFLDSRTSKDSVAEAIADEYQLPTLRRHVFLDNQKDEQSLQRQWQHALTLSQQQEWVVVIAHPYPQTLAFLQQQLTDDSPLARLSHWQTKQVTDIEPVTLAQHPCWAACFNEPAVN